MPFSWLARRDMAAAPPTYSEVELAAAELLRDISIDLENPLIILQEVDGADGAEAAGSRPGRGAGPAGNSLRQPANRSGAAANGAEVQALT